MFAVVIRSTSEGIRTDYASGVGLVGDSRAAR